MSQNAVRTLTPQIAVLIAIAAVVVVGKILVLDQNRQAFIASRINGDDRRFDDSSVGQKNKIDDHDVVESNAISSEQRFDSDLVKLIEAWPTLSDVFKSRIVELIRASRVAQ